MKLQDPSRSPAAPIIVYKYPGGCYNMEYLRLNLKSHEILFAHNIFCRSLMIL